MGATLSTLRKLLEDQLDIPSTTTGTNPTSTLLTSYINNSIRMITRRDRPRELNSATPATADLVVNTNTATIPATIFVPDLVYYTSSGGSIKRILQKDLQTMINIQGPQAFFDTTVTGDPDYYAVRGTSLLFNKHFDRSEPAQINIYGSAFPTTLSDDSDETELPIDYNMLITYEAAILFYQRDDDAVNQLKFQGLAERERVQLRTVLDTNGESEITMDTTIFPTSTYTVYNPNVFFSS